ncbi:MAG: hypothetical protein HY000_29350 [Planctomycetes bacterium]|nr:hypothetical protein [Planctomycetota bacterium]
MEKDRKMSAVIPKLAEPLIEKCGTSTERAEAAIALTIAAWNKALFPADKQGGVEREIIDKLVPPGGSAETVAAIVEMMDLIEERRKKLFPDLRVAVLNYDVQISEGRLTLNVGSAAVSSTPESTCEP